MLQGDRRGPTGITRSLAVMMLVVLAVVVDVVAVLPPPLLADDLDLDAAFGGGSLARSKTAT